MKGYLPFSATCDVSESRMYMFRRLRDIWGRVQASRAVVERATFTTRPFISHAFLVRELDVRIVHTAHQVSIRRVNANRV